MLVKDVMNKEVITVSENENLAQLIAKFRKYNYHTLPVIDNDKKISGLVNSEDIMKVCLPHNPVLERLLKSTHLYDTDEEYIRDGSSGGTGNYREGCRHNECQCGNH